MGKCDCVICRSKRRRRSYNVDTRAHDALKPDTMSTASSGDIDKQALGIKTTDVCILDNIDNIDSKKQAVEELKPERAV